LLVAEPLRYALALRPEWVALEEVPAVAPLFEHTARALVAVGYSTWVGVLNAADFGLAQTRRRVFLLASRTRPAVPPDPTHADGGRPADLFGPGRAPWTTMRDVLGCPPGLVVTRGNHTTGGSHFPTTGPSWAVTGRARSWMLKVGNRPGATRRHLDQPAPTLHLGRALNDVSWCDDGGSPVRRLAVEEAAVLQGFARDYPWAGSRTKQFEQIGNAVPPPLASAVLAALVGPVAALPAGVAA
ncbi:DNA cytosine methyltransferase, partial [Streptacidiphilus griseoplanus]|uniref:DNA cytosine methyltransferase n=1 Tax=Peterkaempfera griseoplana TaxID=66896 RepID=UPI000AFCBB5E